MAHYLIIEAVNVDDAINKMYDITEDYSEYCECCGERWSSWIDDDDGKDEPMVYGKKVKEERPDSWPGGSTIIYYYDGTVEKLWYKE